MCVVQIKNSQQETRILKETSIFILELLTSHKCSFRFSFNRISFVCICTLPRDCHLFTQTYTASHSGTDISGHHTQDSQWLHLILFTVTNPFFFCVKERHCDIKLTTALQTVKLTLLNNALTENPSVHHRYKTAQHSSNVVHNIVCRLIREITTSITRLNRVPIKIIFLQLVKNN